MDVNTFQQEIMRVFTEFDTLPGRTKHTKLTALTHLMEEFGEVARQVTSEVHRPEKFSKENLGEELADMLMFMAVLAEYYGIDLSEEMEKAVRRVEKKIEEIRSAE